MTINGGGFTRIIMRPFPLILLVTATLGAALAGAAYMHPGGLDGLKADLLGEPVSVPGDGDASDPDDGATLPDPKKVDDPAQYAADALKKAERGYERGHFHSAVTQFMMARNFAQTDDERERALTGLRRAVLANALVAGSPRSDLGPEAALAEMKRLKAEAEARPIEFNWLAATRFAAGARLLSETPYLVERALEVAVKDGVIEDHLRASLHGPTQRTLQDALRDRGLNGDLPQGVAVVSNDDPAGAGMPDIDPNDPDVGGDGNPWDDDDANEPSGIGQVGKGPSISVPFGNFSKAVRAKLKQAVQHERNGMREYELAAPGKKNRREHRTKALAELSKARDIFQAALKEDPDSHSVETHLRDIFKMMSFLRKDAHLDE